MALVGLIAFAPRWKRVGLPHFIALGVTAIALGIFFWLSFTSLNYVEKRVGGKLIEMEAQGPQ